MAEQALLTEEMKQGWNEIIEAEGVAPITNREIKNNTIRLLENTAKALTEDNNTGTAMSSNQGAYAAGRYDPVLISMVRRAMPVLVANEMVGVQPMSGPVGIIFAMRTWMGQPNTGVETQVPGTVTDYTASGTSTTAAAEALGVGETVDTTTTIAAQPVVQANPWKEMSFSIDKVSVTAESRALKARYTQELAQDLKAIHGLDAETELANLLSTEVVAEINREMVVDLQAQAKTGASGTAVAGTFNLAVDSDARWQMEAYKSLYFQIEREANIIGRETGRGRGNFLIVSPDVASALEASGKLDVLGLTGVIGGWTGVSKAGVLNGKYNVFVDPFQVGDSVLVGYKGATAYDNGYFYCPYVPLQMMRSTGEEDFQPRIGFKTRYGRAVNPFVGTSVASGAGVNYYYRKFAVTNLAITH